MKVLVACEFSGAVRDAFIAKGHDAWSCDILPSECNGKHIQADIGFVLPLKSDASYRPEFRECWLDYLGEACLAAKWDLLIAFPPCTHLCVSGARWFKDKQAAQRAAIEFFRMLADAPIERVAVENPIGIMSTHYRKPDQIIQPWQFGHGETKATCLWLKGLPKLTPTNIVDGREARIHKMPPGPDRWKERSRTYSGIALAMADQWGNL